VYFFSVVRDKIVCLICSQAVSTPKEYNLRRHYETLSKDKYGVLEGRLRENKLKNIKCDLQGSGTYLLLPLKQMKQQFKQALLYHK
jgi:hypothetical protein